MRCAAVVLFLFQSAIVLSRLPAQEPQPKASPVAQGISSPFQMENSTSKASLRGIHAVGEGVAWASGTDGTVLRTEDAGFVWQSCAMPPGAEKLDFRGVWAWDAMTAIVMASGPGDASRLYKTTDGCVSWKLLATNTDKDGFWDAIAFSDAKNGYLLGDPVDGRFVLRRTVDGGESWMPVVQATLAIGRGKLGAFAASNSALVDVPAPAGDGTGAAWLATGSQAGGGLEAGPFVLRGATGACTEQWLHHPGKNGKPGYSTLVPGHRDCSFKLDLEPLPAPLASGSEAAGVFSLAVRSEHRGLMAMAVGGDYKKPDDRAGTAAWSWEGGQFHAAATPPHGYRSAVAWDAADKAWITAGPNGSDYSLDDGKTWQTLDVTDVKNGWNAISLPWFVGPNGRIGKLVSLPKASPGSR